MSYWSYVNPHVFREGYTQYPQKINALVDILDNHIVGPTCLGENLTRPLYLDVIQNRIRPIIDKIVQAHPNQFSTNDIFQQDGRLLTTTGSFESG